jgi:UDP-2,3-diacylglucosamine hydrolase
MQGNRDLLIGPSFADRCGATLIADPTLVDLYGTQTLLVHGDTLCTDDVSYQQWRTYARDPRNQSRFLAQPLDARRKEMRDLRNRSEAHKRVAQSDIMDVAPAAVEDALRVHGFPRLIHGHTHRPARHVHHIDGHACERWVLTDWYERGGYLRCDAAGCTAIML